MSISEDYALTTAIEIAKEIVRADTGSTLDKKYASATADFIETLYERLSKIELTNQAKS